MAGSETRQRGKIQPVRCTADEFNAIATKADEAGLSIAAYFRAAALGDAGPRAQRRLPADHRLLRQILGHLGRVGNNLNQIARQLNSGEEPHTQMPELHEALNDYMRLRDTIFEALGKTPSQPAATPPVSKFAGKTKSA